MTDRELADAAWAELTKTTDSYPTYLKKGQPSTSHWTKAKTYLDQVGVTVAPTPPPITPPTPPTPPPTTLPPPTTDPAIVDGSTYVNATFTTPIDVGNRHDLTFKNSTFKLGISSGGSSYAHNISFSDCDITNPSGFGVKMASLDTNWSFLRTKIHDCASMAVVWNRYSSVPPNTKWGSGFSFISGEVWNTGLSDGEHAFYLNVHDVHVAGSYFHDYARSAISLRYGGALIEFNDVVEGSRSSQGAFTYYEYDGAPYGTVEIHRNKVTGVTSQDADIWIGTSEGPDISKNYQTFNITDNCFQKPVKSDSSLNPGPHLTVANNARCSDSGAAYYVG